MKYIIPGFIRSKKINNNLNIKNMYTQTTVELEHIYFEQYSALLKNGCSVLTTELENFLFENEILFEKNMIQSTLDYYYSDNETILKIIILPTEKCNFRCLYCYENHDNIINEKIDYDKIRNFILDKISLDKRIQSISILWFGGEPLLKANEIISFNKKIKKISQENKLTFNSSITTNAYLLDKELFKELINSNINFFQITLDGNKHDNFRPLKNGGKTKYKILANLRSIKDTNLNFTINIRVNLSENSTDNELFFQELKDTIGNDKRFFISLSKIFYCDTIKNEIDYCKNDRILEANKKMAITNNLILQTEDNSPISICYASTNNCYTFRPNGKVVKCTVEIDKEWNNVGNAYGDNVFIDKENNSYLSKKLIKDKCIECKNIITCHSMKCLRAKIKEECNYEKKEIENA